MFKPLTLVAAVLTAFSLNAFAKTELTVYTALEAEQLKTYKKAFEQANPDVEIKWVRDSTGIITAKLLAEKDRPQADVVWGLAASSLAILDQQGMLDNYAPKDLDKIGNNYRDAANPPAWVGMDVWAATICFNTVEAEKQGLTKPVSWQDLTKPEYKGKIVMPNPASSGTGFLDVSALAADLRRETRLAVHGRPAPEHRPVRSLRFQALQAGGFGGIPDRYFV